MSAVSRRCALIAGLPLLAGCVLQDVDLRRPPADDGAPVEIPDGCGDGERWGGDPATCEPCVVRPPPEAVCPCGAEPAAEVPPGFCDTEDAAYACVEPCSGGIEQCTGYEAAGTASDCDLLRRCCEQMAGTADACWHDGELLCCVPAPAGGFLVSFPAAGCCTGAACTPGGGECQAWQSCVDGLCKPACRLDIEYCDECGGCVCRPNSP